MVFSSLEFIYIFLIPTLIVFSILRYFNSEKGLIWWLIIASLIFYAWWSVYYLILLLASVIFNYTLHKTILNNRKKYLLILGVIVNMGLLIYFKYADFLISNFNSITGAEISILNVILPLAISFFTFQQISFLFDTYNRKISHCDFAKYCLFVVFFPQLIAGPIVLQKHTIPQFRLAVFNNHIFLNLSIGFTLFAIGLFKKIVFADGMAPIANQVFSLAEEGYAVPMEAAWLGTLAYTFQIYFDFSGYCDMALGLARMFGIKLPINFNSPYKAHNISDFWRRWHITLSTFLRDYLYIPLGGSQYGKIRQYLCLMITMLLGGLWHGASWTFVFWGFLHGIYLACNHSWIALNKNRQCFSFVPAFIKQMLSQSLTFFVVIIAWIFFRAESFAGAQAVLKGLFGFTLFVDPKVWNVLIDASGIIWLKSFILMIILMWFPNSIEMMKNYRPILNLNKSLRTAIGFSRVLVTKLIWRPSKVWACFIFILISSSMIALYQSNNLTEFIYFNF